MNLDLIRRQRALALANGETRPRAKAKQEATGTAKVFLDDVIDSWGWPFGISAKEFRQTLDEITAGEIELHINSPGGEATEGVAMFTALRQHDARVVVMIDGLAASAASLVAMAGDEVVMSLGTTLMIHDAWGLAMGNAEDMTDAAARLNTLSDSYAEIYAERTGRSIEEMRVVMRAEAWLNADQAIEQGFVDHKDDRDGTADEAKARAMALISDNGFTANGTTILSGDITITGDSSGAERALARVAASLQTSQTPSAEPVVSTPNRPQEVTVSTDTTLPDGGTAALGSSTEPTGSPPPAPSTPPTPTSPPSVAGPDLHAEITRLSGEVAAANAREAARDKLEFFDSATTQGRVTPAERAGLEAMYDQAPDATKAFVLARAVGSMVPVAAIGHEGDGETNADDAFYVSIFGKEG